MNLEEFISKYADLRWPGLERYLLRQEEEECAFLEHRDKEAFCSIHYVKPQACHDWTASLYRRECRQGLAETWQLEVNAAGQITGPDEKQRLFKEFMNSLSD
jgi:Fe-S-cluster containining protein